MHSRARLIRSRLRILRPRCSSVPGWVLLIAASIGLSLVAVTHGLEFVYGALLQLKEENIRNKRA
jgi:hypothetical protein